MTEQDMLPTMPEALALGCRRHFLTEAKSYFCQTQLPRDRACVVAVRITYKCTSPVVLRLPPCPLAPPESRHGGLYSS